MFIEINVRIALVGRDHEVVTIGELERLGEIALAHDRAGRVAWRTQEQDLAAPPDRNRVLPPDREESGSPAACRGSRARRPRAAPRLHRSDRTDWAWRPVAGAPDRPLPARTRTALRVCRSPAAPWSADRRARRQLKRRSSQPAAAARELRQAQREPDTVQGMPRDCVSASTRNCGAGCRGSPIDRAIGARSAGGLMPAISAAGARTDRDVATRDADSFAPVQRLQQSLLQLIRRSFRQAAGRHHR